jgi:replicative DNA helicase
MSTFDERALMSVVGEREMPSNIAAEQGLLGALIVHGDGFRVASEYVRERDFGDPVHRKLYSVICALCEKGVVADRTTIATHLDKQDIGGVTAGEYIGRLAGEAAGPDKIADYARVVREVAARRDIIRVAEEAKDLAYDPPPEATADRLFSEIEGKMAELRPRLPGSLGDFEGFDGVSARAILALGDDFRHGNRSRGIPTGLPALDDKIGGLEAPDLILLGGRPGSGKTALGTNVAFSVSRHFERERKLTGGNRRVGFFSLEMSSEQLWQRVMSHETGIPGWRIKQRALSKEEVEKLVLADRELRSLPLDIDASGKITIAQLEQRARKLKKTKGLGFLVIDYVQLVGGRPRSSREDNRVQELTDITTSLKNLAKDLDIPILALAQVSRKVEERDDKRPRLSDLRESGSLEQDADMVLFIHREEYYLDQARPLDGTPQRPDWDRKMALAKGIAEVIVSKQRHGPVGTVLLGFDGNTTRFLNEPEPRDEPTAETQQRERKAKPTFTAEGAILLGVLRALTITATRLPTDAERKIDRSLKKGSRLIAVDTARSVFAREAGLPEAEENEIKKRFTAAFQNLRKAEIAFYTGSEADGYFVWLPEMVDG